MNAFTIGYGGRRFDDFVGLLLQHHIYLVVDIRRFPRSRIPEYNREWLEAELPRFGLSYIWMGEALGGFRRGGYRKYTQSDDHKAGIASLRELAGQGNLVLMCKERKGVGCHRRYIVETLADKGWQTTQLE